MKNGAKIILAGLISVLPISLFAANYQQALAQVAQTKAQATADLNAAAWEQGWKGFNKMIQAKIELDAAKPWYYKMFDGDAIGSVVSNNNTRNFLLGFGATLGAYALYRGGFDGLKDLVKFNLKGWFGKVFSVKKAEGNPPVPVKEADVQAAKGKPVVAKAPLKRAAQSEGRVVRKATDKSAKKHAEKGRKHHLESIIIHS
ncbi:MAG TPA: hypothetical protein VFF04_02275 [Candidatus Babeliales bacterium]|nr:hypothetical protein [Candidatus Babeliales bacterium]